MKARGEKTLPKTETATSHTSFVGKDTNHNLKLVLMLLGILGVVVCFQALGQNPQPTITNVDVSGSIVTITYNLNGNPADDYRVEVYLIDDRSPAATLLLQRARGDVGDGIYVGFAKKIIWDMKLEGVKVSEGQGYRFQLTVTRIEEGGLPWYVYVGGGTALAGAAALLLTKGSNESSTPDVPAKSLPLPPER